MGSLHEDTGSVAYWRNLWEAERDELARSSQVQQKLQAVVQTLRQKSEGLEAEVAQLRATAPPDPRCAELQAELEEAAEAQARSEARREQCASEAAAQRQELREHEGRAAASREALEESRAAAERLQEACRGAAERREEALARARSMVTADALARAAAEAGDLRGQLLEHEAEAARLRQALADSWASRGDPGEQAADGGPAGQEDGPALESLDDVEEQLRWLANMQQQASAEVHHVHKLERTEAALQARLREVSEEQASLRSERVDLGYAGRAMREAMATQSEISVARASELEEARRSTDEDRVKLISEIADAQARLEVLAPELKGLAELEGRHARLNAERRALADASQRLRDVNGALGVLLLGDAGSPSAGAPFGGEEDGATQAAGALTRTLQLHKKFSDRSDAHRLEKQKLADRIQALEFENARSGAVPLDAARPSSSAGGGRGAPAAAASGGALSGAKEAASVAQAAAASAWRGGLERLKDGAATLGL